MTTRFLKDALGWGLGLWFMWYVLGIALFFVVPVAYLGWVQAPIAAIIVLWVLMYKIHGTFGYHTLVGISWTLLAALLDFLLLVLVIKPEEGYQGFVYFFYLLTFFLPMVVGFLKHHKVI